MKFSFEGTAEEFVAFMHHIKGIVPNIPVPTALNDNAGQMQGYPTKVEDAGVYRPVRPLSGTPAQTILPDLNVWETDQQQPIAESPRGTKDVVKWSETENAKRVRDGVAAWYNLITEWSKNLGVEGEPQPNRVAILEEALTDDGRSIFAYLQSSGGLTKSIYDIFPEWGIKQCRRVAEHIAQVSSAMGVPLISDLLEFTKDYRNILKDESSASQETQESEGKAT
jgi:hypothetical protein